MFAYIFEATIRTNNRINHPTMIHPLEPIDFNQPTLEWTIIHPFNQATNLKKEPSQPWVYFLRVGLCVFCVVFSSIVKLEATQITRNKDQPSLPTKILTTPNHDVRLFPFKNFKTQA